MQVDAKRASALVAGIPKGQQGLAKQWYDIVRIHLIGQVAGLVWMVRASSAVGVLRGAATFMAANVLALQRPSADLCRLFFLQARPFHGRVDLGLEVSEGLCDRL